jgi:hypothetical protein
MEGYESICNFIRHKFYTTWARIELWLLPWKGVAINMDGLVSNSNCRLR